MKKIFTTVIAILLTINAFAEDVWDGTASPWTHGTGVSSDPYLIETAENLAYLAQKVNEGYQAQGQAVFKGVYFLMTDDLDLNNINWTPIGNVNMNMQGYYFAGIFDGWYHNIDHLKIQSSADVCGLFAGLGDRGEINHLSVTNGNITSTGTGAAGIVGGVAGNAWVYQCSFSGSITVNNNGSFCGAGGIAAVASGFSYICQCSFHGSINVTNNGGFTGAAGAGGIVGVGLDETMVNYCYNTGTITANAMLLSVAAGIMAATTNDDQNNIGIICSYNVGTVSAATKGGIFGMISPINPMKNENTITVESYYLNTCGGNTNYGYSKTSAEMKSDEFLNLISGNMHTFAKDNGTNNGYPINSLFDYKVWEASEITHNSAKLSATIHQGHENIVSAAFYYNVWNIQDEIEVAVPTDGYVEVTLENLEPDTDYWFSFGGNFAYGDSFGGGAYDFHTAIDGLVEISDNDNHIYPNPTSDFIHIENIKPQSVSIYSLDGKLIKSIETANVIDVRDLNEGIYLINIGGKVGKVIIER